LQLIEFSDENLRTSLKILNLLLEALPVQKFFGDGSFVCNSTAAQKGVPPFLKFPQLISDGDQFGIFTLHLFLQEFILPNELQSFDAAASLLCAC
jgi:hypothetical protein